MLGARSLLLGGVAGFLIAFSLPPWGWWPLAFAGFALLDWLCGSDHRSHRFLAGWAGGMVWLAMGELWMFDLTAPGYFFVFIVFGAGYGVIAALVGPTDRRLLLLPAGMVLYEWLRWSWPFGGVPLATVPMTQVDSPLAAVLPLGGGLLLTAVTVATGSTFRLLFERRFDMAGIIFGSVTVAVLIGAVVPTGSPIETLDVAVVQGGGPQRTRADVCENQRVFDRHREATSLIDRSVDLVMWPENVVNPIADGTWFHDAEPGKPEGTVNYSTAITADGETVSRYDKVRIVPFGEFVPLRGFIENFSSDIPRNDVVAGTGPAILESPVATLGVSISWEVFFERRGRAAIRDGGEILVNPTNGSSYWLTILQSQQVASSRLRARETGRWVLQAAPTGFSAIVDPAGNVIERTGISEQRVLYGTIERRTGLTLATRFGDIPMLVLAALAVAITLIKRPFRDPGTAKHA